MILPVCKYKLQFVYNFTSHSTSFPSIIPILSLLIYIEYLYLLTKVFLILFDSFCILIHRLNLSMHVFSLSRLILSKQTLKKLNNWTSISHNLLNLNIGKSWSKFQKQKRLLYLISEKVERRPKKYITNDYKNKSNRQRRIRHVVSLQWNSKV